LCINDPCRLFHISSRTSPQLPSSPSMLQSLFLVYLQSSLGFSSIYRVSSSEWMSISAFCSISRTLACCSFEAESRSVCSTLISSSSSAVMAMAIDCCVDPVPHSTADSRRIPSSLEFRANPDSSNVLKNQRVQKSKLEKKSIKGAAPPVPHPQRTATNSTF
jgi:hypothetical protein